MQLELGSGVFEAVTSSEVIEHLDPPELKRFWDIHLGVLQPNLLIVTTPNRDFNILFDKVNTLSRTPRQSYTREGLNYSLRDGDHRFEYTRAEFEEEYSRFDIKLIIDHEERQQNLSIRFLSRA